MNQILFYSTFKKNISNDFNNSIEEQPVIYLLKKDGFYGLLETELDNNDDISNWLLSSYQIDIDPEYIITEMKNNNILFKINLNSFTEMEVLNHFEGFSYHTRSSIGVKKLFQNNLIHKDSSDILFQMEINDFHKISDFYNFEYNNSFKNYYMDNVNVFVHNTHAIQLTFNNIKDIQISFKINKSKTIVEINIKNNNKNKFFNSVNNEDINNKLNIIKEGLETVHLYDNELYEFLKNLFIKFNFNNDVVFLKESIEIKTNQLDLKNFILDLSKRYFHNKINFNWVYHLDFLEFLYLNHKVDFELKINTLSEYLSLEDKNIANEFFKLNFKY